MSNLGLVTCFVLAGVSAAYGSIDVHLQVTDMGPNVGGAAVDTFDPAAYTPKLGVPVSPGDNLLIHTWMKADRQIDIRIAQLQWGLSTYPWELMGHDVDTINQPLDDIPNFWFDYSGLLPTVSSFPAQGSVVIPPFGGFPSTGAHQDFSNLMVTGSPFTAPQTAFDGVTGTDLQLHMPAGEWFHLGAMPITVPEGTESYVLDAVTSSDVNDFHYGALIQFGFGGEGDPITMWGSSTGDTGVSDSIQYAPGHGPITYDGASGTFMPEPASLALLAIGGIAVLRRRAA